MAVAWVSNEHAVTNQWSNYYGKLTPINTLVDLYVELCGAEVWTGAFNAFVSTTETFFTRVPLQHWNFFTTQ